MRRKRRDSEQLNGPKGRLTPSFRPVQQEKAAPCQIGCATSGDVRGWVGLVAQREKMGLTRADAYARAWGLITDVNPFPSVMGRVCPHPCQGQCNRSVLDEPVAINAMERFLGDWALDQGLPLRKAGSQVRDEWIGVIGAGPSGLSFAYQMVRRGYRVTVYEGREKAGGMLRYGIPDYRLPPEVLDAEVARILALGVELKLETLVGRDLTVEELRERHTALYLGMGAQRGRELGIPGADGPGMWTGTDYLERLNRGAKVDLGSAVAVVGGGNTAVDAARSARRTGAEVTILYRRSREEMPAIAHEIDDALEEGIDLVLLVAPLRVERGEDESLRALWVQRMVLGEPDESGRRRPVPLPGSEYRLPVDSVIAAVSQEPDLRGFERVVGEDGWIEADSEGAILPGVWAGGDVLGLGIAGFAIAKGRQAAEALHRRLTGEIPPPPGESPAAGVGPDQIGLEFHERTASAKPPRLDPSLRIGLPVAEVSQGISEDQFLAEADRCFSCGSCFGCQQCSMYCTVGSFVRLDEVRPGAYFALSLDECQECGKCVEVCPCGYLDLTNP